MKLFTNLFGKNNGLPPNGSSDPEHAVLIHFNYGLKDLDPLHALEDKLRAAIDHHEMGEYDGHEIALDHSDGILFMYGPNAERLYLVVQPLLKQAAFMKGAVATLRFGPPEEEGAREIEIEI